MQAQKLQPESMLTLADFEAQAENCMSPMAYGYIVGGAADELTLRANSEDWRRIRVCPRVLVDVSEISLQTEILGQQFEMPILLAPAAFHRLCHSDGERATIAGANEGGTTLVLSSFSTESVEDIAAMAQHPLWFQLYFQKDKGLTQQMVDRAHAAGCKALCITVDTPVLGLRHRESRIQFQLPKDFKLPNLNLGPVTHRPVRSAIYSELLNPTLVWKDVDWLCSVAKVPVLLKGILNPEDTKRALDTGVSGLIVSNHGARNLDTLPSTAEALPRVAEAINGKLPLLVDGGIRRGTDVLKALALGAKAVLIGRPYLYALAHAGAAGVARAIEILRTELLMAMALTGCTSISQISRSVLWDRST
ncbi:MAG TPA: alpha-hydroxy acid oxidase [Candidatus Angelobacter sp.]|jgi:4-hydroxymandelate oxidase|nr:alpha-hydroxy acid oxidase [Candidatus Angelobacter sp.]